MLRSLEQAKLPLGEIVEGVTPSINARRKSYQANEAMHLPKPVNSY